MAKRCHVALGRLLSHHVVPLRFCPAKQIKVRPASVIPHQMHRGRGMQAVIMRAMFGFGLPEAGWL